MLWNLKVEKCTSFSFPTKNLKEMVISMNGVKIRENEKKTLPPISIKVPGSQLRIGASFENTTYVFPVF